jgi:hypothetical protein
MDDARLLGQPGDVPEQELRVRAHQSERHDDVAGLERSRGGLREDRRVEHEVLGADDRGAVAPEQARDIAAREAAAHDQDSASRAMPSQSEFSLLS